jgi:hypothetical protein
MRQDDNSLTTTTPLHVCTDCQEPFVVPISVLDVIDSERCVVELHCANCEETRIGVHTDAELIDLDRQLESSTAAMHNAVEVFEALDEWERAERFVEALHAGLILPEDF